MLSLFRAEDFPAKPVSIILADEKRTDAVSYTHIDVYKRQVWHLPATEELSHVLKTSLKAVLPMPLNHILLFS